MLDNEMSRLHGSLYFGAKCHPIKRRSVNPDLCCFRRCLNHEASEQCRFHSSCGSDLKEIEDRDTR